MSRLQKEVLYQDLGVVGYQDAWDYQEKMFGSILNQKSANTKLSAIEKKPTSNYLLFCEHPHVYTLGKSGKDNNLLVNNDFLESINADLFRINRGGDITYHGPGQLVGYPILDLDNFDIKIKLYIHMLEEVIIRAIGEFGLKGERLEGATGVWLKPLNGRVKKICAMGVRVSRWVSMHGFALNVNPDMTYFNHINPCGFVDKEITSLALELGRKVELSEVKPIIKNQFSDVFGMQIKPASA